MKKILAISGGIDSMVMLHMFKDDQDVVVAHFNHGTRPSACLDESFCRRFAAIYHHPFYSQKITLGSSTSEEKARSARYQFLNSLAKELKGEIYTAHHADDLIESIAINLLRGTGWRGLQPLSLHHHPLLYTGPGPVYGKNMLWYKKDIIKYAAENNIIFRQDPTNAEDNYLRNRLRPLLKNLPLSTKESLISLYRDQETIKKEIDGIINNSLPKNNKYDCAYFKSLPSPVAIELLRAALLANNIKATRPQLNQFFSAIHTYQSGKKFNLPQDKFALITKTTVSFV